MLVLSTGSELVEPGTPLQPGQIYESNGPMLAAAVEEAGGRAELLRFVPDDVAEFLGRLRERLSAGDVDLVLTSGGVSAGAYEVVKDAFTGRGVEFVKVGMQPGGPQGAGRVDELGGVAVVTLPGNPVSSQVSFEVFVRPALRAALGHPHPDRPVVTARLARTLDLAGRPPAVPARPTGRGARRRARDRWPAVAPAGRAGPGGLPGGGTRTGDGAGRWSIGAGMAAGRLTLSGDCDARHSAEVATIGPFLTSN